MIRVQCPYCQRRYRTMTEAMGKTAVCTGCNESFRIGEQRVPFQWKDTDLSEDSWIGGTCPKGEEGESAVLHVQCPHGARHGALP